MTAVPVSQLSRPKGASLECELCGQPATLQLKECPPCFYCSKEHLRLDWEAVRRLIAKDCVMLANTTSLPGSREERRQIELEVEKLKNEVMAVASEAARRFLIQGQHELALPGAMVALKMARSLYGKDCPDLVPLHMLLAEANLGLRQLSVAEEYLSIANWTLVKGGQSEGGKAEGEGASGGGGDGSMSANTRYAMLSLLHRNFGRLYAARHNYIDALHAFAEDVYFCCLRHGPHSLLAAPSFFHLASIVEHLEAASSAASPANSKSLALYEKVATNVALTLRLRAFLRLGGKVRAARPPLTVVRLDAGAEGGASDLAGLLSDPDHYNVLFPETPAGNEAAAGHDGLTVVDLDEAKASCTHIRAYAVKRDAAELAALSIECLAHLDAIPFDEAVEAVADVHSLHDPRALLLRFTADLSH